MSNEMKASVSDFKHKFYDECIDVPFEMPDGITAEELEIAVSEIAKRSDDCFAYLLNRCDSDKIEVLPSNMTEEEFLAWVRSHE